MKNRSLKAILVSIIALSFNLLFAVSDNGQVKNVIIMIPDGMSAGGVSLARWYNGGEPFSFDPLISGLVRTYWANGPITDSAPAATAYATGYKSTSGFISVMPDVATMYKTTPVKEENARSPLATILEGTKLSGKATGLVATSNIQHATPAGFSSHYYDRNNYQILGEQQLYNGIDVMLGGGSKFLQNRTDGEDLIEVIKAKGYDYVTTSDEMAKSKGNKIWGAFAPEGMLHDIDRAVINPNEPSLAEMTAKALSILSQDRNGFFLMVEGSEIDWSAHANDPVGVISDILAFDKAVKIALDFAKKDGNTALIIMTDHGNGGITIGNSATNSDYDKVPLSKFLDPLKKAKLSGLGLGNKFNSDKSNIREVLSTYYGITDLTDDEVTAIAAAHADKLDYTTGPIISKRAFIGWTTHGHTGEDIALYTYIPKGEKLSGYIQNTDIARYVARVMDFYLDKLTSKLYVNAIPALKAMDEVSYQITSPNNPALVITKGDDTISIPSNKNYFTVNGKNIETKSVSVYISDSKFYVSQEVIDYLKEDMKNNNEQENQS